MNLSREDKWAWASKKIQGGFSVDEDIEDFVLALISKGFVTEGSCAGHIGYGFIWFSGRLSKPKKRAIESLAEKLGIRNLVRESYDSSTDITGLTFSPHLKEGRRDFWGDESPDE